VSVLPYIMGRRRAQAIAVGEVSAQSQVVDFGTAIGGSSSISIVGALFGDDAADRVIVFDMAQRSHTQARFVSSVTIGGVAATRGGCSDPASNRFARHGTWAAAIPSGASGDIVVTMSGALSGLQCSYVVYRLTGTGGSATAKATNVANYVDPVSSRSVSVAVQTGDVVIGGACRGDADGEITLTGVTTRLSTAASTVHYGVHGADVASADDTTVIGGDPCHAMSGTVYGPAA
jgi:hypothetical protein